MLGLVKTNLDTAKSSISVGRFLQPKLWQKVATDQTTPSSVRKSRVGTLRMIEHAILMAFIGICVQGKELIFFGSLWNSKVDQTTLGQVLVSSVNYTSTGSSIYQPIPN